MASTDKTFTSPVADPAGVKEQLRASAELAAVLHFLHTFAPVVRRLNLQLTAEELEDALIHEDPCMPGFSPILSRVHEALIVGFTGPRVFDKLKAPNNEATWPKALANALRREDWWMYSDRDDIDFINVCVVDSKACFKTVSETAELYTKLNAFERVHLLHVLVHLRLETDDVRQALSDAVHGESRRFRHKITEQQQQKRKQQKRKKQQQEQSEDKCTLAMRANHRKRLPLVTDSAECLYYFFCFTDSPTMRRVFKEDKSTGQWICVGTTAAEIEGFIAHVERTAKSQKDRAVADAMEEHVVRTMQAEEKKEARRRERHRATALPKRALNQLGTILPEGSTRGAAKRARKALEEVDDNKPKLRSQLSDDMALPAWMRSRRMNGFAGTNATSDEP